MHRTLPATEQLQQVDGRIKELKENVIDNIKNSQILRSNFTTMMYSSKEANEKVKCDVTELIAGLRKSLEVDGESNADTVQEMEKELVGINCDRREIYDGILLLDNRIRDLEGTFGCFTVEEHYEL